MVDCLILIQVICVLVMHWCKYRLFVPEEVMDLNTFFLPNVQAEKMPSKSVNQMVCITGVMFLKQKRRITWFASSFGKPTAGSVQAIIPKPCPMPLISL